VVVEAVVVSEEPVEQVSFAVDGIVVGELDAPPWRLEVEVGEANRRHEFRVVAYGRRGGTGEHAITTPAFRVDEEVRLTLQQLYVTVAGPDGRRVLDLEEEQFRILDEGKRQDLVTFARGDVPFTGVVLVDSSLSMEGPKLSAALAGARSFFAEMRPLDEGRLVVFSDRILHQTPFSTFSEVLTAGLTGVEAQGGTAVNDHLYLALKQLEARQGRRVVVLLSDGVDSHSVLSMGEVLESARRSQALIYWVRLPLRPGDGGELPDVVTTWRSSAEHRREHDLLRRTVEESGGRIELVRSLDDIAPAFAGILQELREQYVLGFYPDRPRHDGGWRRLQVRVEGRGLRVRAREGYVDR
jgi:Ca-activated chloride channel family protein